MTIMGWVQSCIACFPAKGRQSLPCRRQHAPASASSEDAYRSAAYCPSIQLPVAQVDALSITAQGHRVVESDAYESARLQSIEANELAGADATTTASHQPSQARNQSTFERQQSLQNNILMRILPPQPQHPRQQQQQATGTEAWDLLASGGGVRRGAGEAAGGGDDIATARLRRQQGTGSTGIIQQTTASKLSNGGAASSYEPIVAARKLPSSSRAPNWTHAELLAETLSRLTSAEGSSAAADSPFSGLRGIVSALQLSSSMRGGQHLTLAAGREGLRGSRSMGNLLVAAETEGLRSSAGGPPMKARHQQQDLERGGQDGRGRLPTAATTANPPDAVSAPAAASVPAGSAAAGVGRSRTVGLAGTASGLRRSRTAVSPPMRRAAQRDTAVMTSSTTSSGPRATSAAGLPTAAAICRNDWGGSGSSKGGSPLTSQKSLRLEHMEEVLAQAQIKPAANSAVGHPPLDRSAASAISGEGSNGSLEALNPSDSSITGSSYRRSAMVALSEADVDAAGIGLMSAWEDGSGIRDGAEGQDDGSEGPTIHAMRGSTNSQQQMTTLPRMQQQQTAPQQLQRRRSSSSQRIHKYSSAAPSHRRRSSLPESKVAEALGVPGVGRSSSRLLRQGILELLPEHEEAVFPFLEAIATGLPLSMPESAVAGAGKGSAPLMMEKGVLRAGTSGPTEPSSSSHAHNWLCVADDSDDDSRGSEAPACWEAKNLPSQPPWSPPGEEDPSKQPLWVVGAPSSSSSSNALMTLGPMGLSSGSNVVLHPLPLGMTAAAGPSPRGRRSPPPPRLPPSPPGLLPPHHVVATPAAAASSFTGGAVVDGVEIDFPRDSLFLMNNVSSSSNALDSSGAISSSFLVGRATPSSNLWRMPLLSASASAAARGAPRLDLAVGAPGPWAFATAEAAAGVCGTAAAAAGESGGKALGKGGMAAAGGQQLAEGEEGEGQGGAKGGRPLSEARNMSGDLIWAVSGDLPQVSSGGLPRVRSGGLKRSGTGGGGGAGSSGFKRSVSFKDEAAILLIPSVTSGGRFKNKD